MIATAEAKDAEMAARIERHRAERGEAWRTIEAPLALAEAIRRLDRNDVAVVDCLTLWLSNLMASPVDVEDAVSELVATLRQSPAMIWVVSNEVGWGIVPDNPLARRFRDEAGLLHQRIGAVSTDVILMVSGLALCLKSSS